MMIVIEGCVGAGKTTLANGLANYRNSKLLLEEFDRNPFLRAFYDDPIENAMETEFTFLLLHYHQLKNETHAASEELEVVTDFHLAKDLLYANLNLPERARTIFAQLYDLTWERIPSPALLIFLSASTDLLVKRITERNRSFELLVDHGYYAKVNAAYEAFFETYPGKKLRVSMDEWDFIKVPALYKQLSTLVDGKLNPNG